MSSRYLFLDTSYFVTIGLIDENFDFINYQLFENRKGSTILHKEIYLMLKENKMKIKDIDALIISSGPGSYTGMRLAEGFAQILEIDKLKVFSFYHFEVPKMIGVTEGWWCSEAFKSEIFVHRWNGEDKEQSLVKEGEFERKVDINSDNIFTHTGTLLENHFQSTNDLIKKHSKTIFKQVVDRAEHLETYYYRPLEKEFRMSGQ
ncbi:hypothetical protein OAT67_01925 [Bacteriovoracaceae bacterium]|nr:hypothetical protein [Bacteriovoracaceae bacterium]